MKASFLRHPLLRSRLKVRLCSGALAVRGITEKEMRRRPAQCAIQPYVRRTHRGTRAAIRGLRHTLALYREALNSNTPIYRFLCFYIIIETSINRWNRLDPQHKISLGPQRKGERIPAGASRVEMEQWLAALFHVNRNWDEGILGEIFIPEVRGKKITNVFENQLREIRHKVAYGSLDSGDVLLLDESEDRELVVKWLPFLRCAARRRMKNDFDTFLRYLGEDGVVVADPDE